MARHRHRHSSRAAIRIRRFVAVYGWRAYAVPVLTVLTIVTLLRPSLTGSSTSDAAADRTGSAVTATSVATSDIPDDLSGNPDDSPDITDHSGALEDSPSSTLSAAATAQRVLGVRGAGSRTAVPPAAARATGPTGADSQSTSAHSPSGSTGTSAAVQAFTPAVDPADAWACASNTYPTLVLVSLSRQHAWMCQGRHEVAATAVTTGNVAAGDATPTGTWTVQNKQTDRYLVGPGYRDYVHYWMPFHGDFGFHDAPWQTFPFGSPDYRTDGSHGCVHLPTAAMAWLYSWASIGSTAVTIES